MSKSTLDGYHYRLKHFIRWCEQEGIDNLNDLTGRKLQKFKTWRRDGGDGNPALLAADSGGLSVRRSHPGTDVDRPFDSIGVGFPSTALDELQGPGAPLTDMDLDTDAGDRERLASKLLTVVLAVVALRSFRRGKQLTGLVAGGAAVALGFAGTTGRPYLEERSGVDVERGTDIDIGETSGSDAAGEEGRLRCSICGDPIVPGEPRGPDPNDEVAHVACTERLQEG